MSRPSWIGYTLGGRYKIEALLGQGGMSSVYRAHDPNLRRTVAVKLIHAHLSHDPEFVRRFEAEAASVAQWRHPNIVQVFDFNHDEDTYYMVMEFLPGDSLQGRLKKLSEMRQRLPISATAAIIGAVADAVAYAHERGTVHRDLKPANVMMTAKDVPVLTDFGVAKILGGQTHTVTGAIIGTPAYMSPEQVRGEALDGRADIYSLGVMLYEMAAGRPPFEGDSAMTVMMKHVNEPVPDIQTLADVPPALKNIVDRALAKNPAHRYQHAADMAAELQLIAGPAPRRTGVTDVAPPPVGATVIEPMRPAGPPAPPPVGATVREPVPTNYGQPQRPATGYTQAPSGYTQAPPAAQPQPGYTQAPATGYGQPPPAGYAPPAQPAQPPARRPNILLIGGVVLAVVVCGLAALGIGAALGGPALLAMLGGATPTSAAALTDVPATATTASGEAPTATAETVVETSTVEVVVPPTDVPPTETSAPPTNTPEPTAIPVPEGMVLIPAGTFQMGAAAGDAQPIHSVTLAPFFLDQYEVTNARYRACEASGACTPPARRGSDTRGGYYTDTTYDQFPVLNITWEQASTFCQSEGGRLPTEAEWEYAATGGDGRRYPWGNDFDRSLVPVSVADTQAVGSFPGGVSPFGVYDMAGNALEWVNDWYSDGYYAVSPPENPLGPDTGTRKVLRGGSFGNPDGTIYLTTRRFSRPPNGADVDIGFRCMRPVQ